jgi:adenosylmethionine-8-amino-7-oxononanoate aminotransferase
MTAFWHPFADMGAVAQRELVIERGEGVHVFDTDGRRYLDGTASLWYANLGHGRDDITAAVAAQMDRLAAYSTFGDFSNPPANALAERLAGHAPMDGAKVFFGSGGGDAIDTAAKLARRHWIERGQPERVHIISRSNGYHGTHAFGTAIGGIEANVSNWGPLVPHTSVVAHDSLPALEQQILTVGPDRVAAFFCEPVIGAGGVFPPAPGYIDGVADLCAEHGVLLVVDSVICAFGRLGTWFGIERWPEVRPDMITFAKGVTSGYLPLGGVVVSGAVAEPFFAAPGGPSLRHGATYAGHPTCCAAAMAVLDAYEAEGLIERGRELEGPLQAALAGLADHPAVGEVRAGTGLLGAVALSEEALAADPGAVAKVAGGAREAGVLVRALLRGVAVSPPLIVTEDQIRELADGIRAGLERVG